MIIRLYRMRVHANAIRIIAAAGAAILAVNFVYPW